MAWQRCSSLSHAPRAVCPPPCGLTSTYRNGMNIVVTVLQCEALLVDVCKTAVFVTTCISPQAFPPSPQPLFSAFPALDSLEMMAAMRAGSIPCLCPTLLILDLYFSILSASVFAMVCEACTPLERNQTDNRIMDSTST